MLIVAYSEENVRIIHIHMVSVPVEMIVVSYCCFFYTQSFNSRKRLNTKIEQAHLRSSNFTILIERKFNSNDSSIVGFIIQNVDTSFKI